MSKVFIAFLGTTDYNECVYYFDKNNIPDKSYKYIQEYLINELCTDWTNEDKILILLTEESKEKNWNNKLEGKLNDLGLKTEIKAINTPHGKTRDEIWETFDILCKEFDKEEYKEIIFDITHSFRSLPMLMMSLINYLKSLKKIEDISIYYGAFTESDETKVIKGSTIKIAPVFDLSAFSDLHDWSYAINSFIKNGIATDMKELTRKEINPIFKKGDNNSQLRKLSNMANALDYVSNKISTSCLRKILLYDFNRVITNIDSLMKMNLIINPLIPLLKVLKNKLEHFNTDNYIIKGFYTIEWCIEYNLIQQGLTILSEFIITYFAEKLGNKWSTNDIRLRLDISKFVQRATVPREKRNVEGNIDKDKENYELYNKIENLLNNNTDYSDLANLYSSVTDNRNIVNHACFSDTEPRVLEDKLKDNYEKAKEIIYKIEEIKE
ncbi:MAG: TIGR02221 family CRISPR-associated protein [Spirochaetota bacterium]